MKSFPVSLSLLLFAGLAHGAEPSSPQLPPVPVANPGPVEFFRNLLEMAPAERADAIQDRSPEQRSLIQSKIGEYLAMPSQEREVRLRVTQLRYYLRPLLSIPAENRAPYLEAIPESDEDLIRARLDQWDQMSPEDQQEMLRSEEVLNYLTRPETRNLPPLPPGFDPEFDRRRQRLEASLERWRSLPEDRRQRVMIRFGEFFTLSDREKDDILDPLTEAQRQQMNAALAQYHRLTPAQRQQCIQSFRKLAGMSPEERMRFLHSAEKWKQMSEDERQAWRNIVSKVPPTPPLPPGAQLPPLPSDASGSLNENQADALVSNASP